MHYYYQRAVLAASQITRADNRRAPAPDRVEPVRQGKAPTASTPRTARSPALAGTRPTFVGSLPISVQREKMNGVDAEPLSSWWNST